MSVKITLCYPGSLGTDDLCDLPVIGMVDPVISPTCKMCGVDF